jgi:hypothetical protein
MADDRRARQVDAAVRYVSNQDAWYARVFVHATLARRPIRNHAINRSFDRASIHHQSQHTKRTYSLCNLFAMGPTPR